MALIPCNNCEYLISDAATACPKCSYKTGVLTEGVDTETFQCPECHKALTQKTDVCPNCAYPLSSLNTEVPETESKSADLSPEIKKKTKTNKKVIMLGGGLVLTVLIAFLYSINNKHRVSSDHQNPTQKSPSETTATATPEPVEFRYINALSANIHEKPSADSQVLFEANINDAFELTGQTHQEGENKWLQLKAQAAENSNQGWIRDTFISPQVIEQKIYFQDQCIVVDYTRICVGDGFDTINLKSINFLSLFPDDPTYEKYEDYKDYINENGNLYMGYYSDKKDNSGINVHVKNNIITSISIHTVTSYLYEIDLEQERRQPTPWWHKEKKHEIPRKFIGKDEHGIGLGSSQNQFENMLMNIYSKNQSNYICQKNIDEEKIQCIVDVLDNKTRKNENSNSFFIEKGLILVVGLSGSLNSSEKHKEWRKDNQSGSQPQYEIYYPNNRELPDSNTDHKSIINNKKKQSEDQVIQNRIEAWQDIKRKAFVNGDTSSLSTVLTGKALTDTEGGVSWWRTNGQYHDITLNSLDFLDTQITGTSASVRVRISETKNNSVEGRKTSTYNATYGLEKRGENWYISSVAAD